MAVLGARAVRKAPEAQEAHGVLGVQAVQSMGGSGNLNGIWGSDPNSVWVVGSGGTILRYQP